MVIINNKVLAILPYDDPVSIMMREWDPDNVELITEEYMKEAGKPLRRSLFSMSLECAEWQYRGKAQWVCPD